MTLALPFLNEMVALFAVAALLAYVGFRLRLPPIIGFLVAGVLIGPHALGLVANQEVIDVLAEVGVILLLFSIGIEFSIARLSAFARAIFAGGGIQVGLTVGIVTGLLVLLGVTPAVGIYTGCLVALSSTAIVLGLYSERKEIDTPPGQLSLALLIFQDLAIVGMVLLVPILAGQGGGPLAIALVLGKALALIAGVLILARRVVPWLLERIARTQRQELFLLVVVAICFGTAALSSLAGVSLALGAFLAGLVVSESHYSEQAMSEILPLRTIFTAVFFVSVGMLLDLTILIDHLLLIGGIILGVILLKTLTAGVSILALGYPARLAAIVGLGLFQIGEFSFVLEREGAAVGLSPAGLGELGTQVFLASTVILMLATPFLMRAGPRVGELLARTPLARLGKGMNSSEDASSSSSLEDHVIIVGLGRAGRSLVSALGNKGIPYEVTEMNPRLVARLREEGVPVIYGDASNRGILEHAGIMKAKMLVVVINDPRTTRRIVQTAHLMNPTVQIIARTRYIADIERLGKLGADIVVTEEMETTVRIFSQVLGGYMIPKDEIERHARALRAEDYGVMRGSIQEAHLMVLQGLDEEGLHTRAIAIREGTPAAGCALEELRLRRDYALSVIAVRRGERTFASPAGDFRLQPGDRIVAIGMAEKFAEAAELFRPRESESVVD